MTSELDILLCLFFFFASNDRPFIRPGRKSILPLPGLIRSDKRDQIGRAVLLPLPVEPQAQRCPSDWAMRPDPQGRR